jgi:DNA polymerase I-like protein with 3'-5' exonuclease and polymerase domains
LIDDIYQEGRFVFDLETDSLNVIDANLVGVAICFNTKEIILYSSLQHKNLDGEIIKDQINFEKALKNFSKVF